MVDERVGTEATLQEIKTHVKKIREAVGNPEHEGIIYAMHIDASESDPYEAVRYLMDDAEYIPAYMDFLNGEFNWGSWEDAFFMPKPCMLLYDGTVDYYLDPDDYTKKADGTASDVADTAYGGNAMMEWGQNGKKIWLKVVPENTTSAYVYIADHQADSGYNCWPFIDSAGNQIDHFYTPIYNGSNVSSVLRSISGQTPMKSQTASTERTYARANNPNDAIWDTEVWCDIELINYLLILMGKSLNTQAVFGEGVHTNGTEAINGTFRTGVHNDKGLFWGTNSGTCASNDFANTVKVFGMENWWGYQWRRFAGLVNDNGTIRYKLTRSTRDGTAVGDYVISTSSGDYSGKYFTGPTVPSVSGTYINAMTFLAGLMIPKTASGSSTTYYCDGLWTNNSQVDYASRGGSSSSDGLVGAFALVLNGLSSSTDWTIGAAPSCKPLAS